jgi:hypothetical protein
MLFDLTFPCYLTTFSGKKGLSGKVICAFFVPLIGVFLYNVSDLDPGLLLPDKMGEF